MRKWILRTVMLMLLAAFVAASTKYTVAWRDSTNATSSAEPYRRQFNASSIGIAQHVDHQAAHPEIAVAVDGARAPERIPDWMAYRHFISMNSLAKDAHDEARSQRDRRLDRVGLSARDRAALLKALNGKREKIDDIVERRKRWTDNSPQSESWRRVLRLEEKQVFDEAQHEIGGALSFEGMSRLSQHIEDMKKGIVIYGSMPQF